MTNLKSYSFWNKRLIYVGNFSVMTRDIMTVVRQEIFRARRRIKPLATVFGNWLLCSI